ncbi:hypothetical protein ACSSVY_004100 [Roseovarius sp. MBR-51]|jgi:hypothetical protein
MILGQLSVPTWTLGQPDCRATTGLMLARGDNADIWFLAVTARLWAIAYIGT